jgi:BUD22
MPKRKRDEGESDGDEDRAQKIRKNRFRVKVEQGNKAIASALRLARGFERQKLGRRQKTAKNDPKELLRLKEEVIALKALDLGQTAQKYLFKQLAKTKRIKESATFVAIYGSEPAVEAPKPGAEANVAGRLFNSNPIKEVMPGIMKGIMGCLGIEDVAGGQNNVTNRPLVKGKAVVKSRTSDEDEFEGFSPVEDTANVPRNTFEARADDIGDNEDDEMVYYDDRLAFDSSSDSEGEELGIFEASSKPLNGTNKSSKLADDISLSASPPPPLVPKSSTKVAEATPKPLSTTTFLPSLMMGGYYSGSDSDDGDGFHDSHNDPLQPKQRKNRRGQRARQEIAEKKYGKNANHLKKAAAKEARSRDAGWDAKKGATEGRGRGRDFGNRMGGRNNGRKPTGPNGDAVVGRRDFGAGRGRVETKAKDNEGPLHPSWEAAKKRKEQSLGTTQAFSGKKVTFD